MNLISLKCINNYGPGSKNCLYTIENSGPKLFIYFIELGSKIVYILDRNRVQNCLLRFIELGTKIAIRTGSVIFTTRLILIYKIVLKIAHQTVAQKIINYQFLSYDIESVYKTCIYWICILKQNFIHLQVYDKHVYYTTHFGL
jgi:hypothetical protein